MSREFAGLLSERVTIERPSAERNSQGLRVAGWETLARCLAAVHPDGTGPQAEAMALSAMPRFRLLIRRREGVAVDQRIRWRNRVLTIRQVLEDPRMPDRLTLRCEEVRQ